MTTAKPSRTEPELKPPVSIRFRVAGRPRPKGSTRSMMKGGKLVTFGMSRHEPGWRKTVRRAAIFAWQHLPWNGPVRLVLSFQMPRPKRHYLRGQVRAGMPEKHVSTPDADKLARSVKDALAGVLYADDSQVWSLEVHKTYGDPPGGVTVWAHMDGGD